MGKLIQIVVAALVLGAVVDAHHSYTATYDTSKKLTLEGKLVQFSFKNPHSFVSVQAADSTGTLQRWSVEWAGTSQLAEAGVTRTSLKVGDDVILIINPSRVPNELNGLMITLKRPKDGFEWGLKAAEKVD